MKENLDKRYIMGELLHQSLQAEDDGSASFLRMEGLSVTDACKELCRKLLTGEITLEQYLSYVTPSRGNG